MLHELSEKLARGEGLEREFKACRKGLSRDVFESVCAFLNRSGGEIYLGVEDDGTARGIDASMAGQLRKEFATGINNPQIVNPPCYLSMEEIEATSGVILRILVPQSSQVHRCKGRVFDRNEDGDLDITDQQAAMASMYLRKQTTYSETTILPFVELADLRSDLILRARKRAALQSPGHPWAELDDMELLKSAQLWSKDFRTGRSGINLAGVLLLGRDETILSALPHHRTDAILRRDDTDRYDDRDDIRTNLLDSYERLMAFVAKHLPDHFHMERDQRISLRDHIFREVVANSLIHREYLDAYPAKFVIARGEVVAENANKAHGHGLIDPEHFSPYPKNPLIARFFREIGWAEELGSGVRQLHKFAHLYGGTAASFEEGDVFRIRVPLIGGGSSQATAQATAQARLLTFCKEPRSREEMQAFLGLSHREHFRKDILKPLLEQGLLTPLDPDKPTSPRQRYIAQPRI